MTTLTYHTAGESHGPALTTLIQGIPAGLEIEIDFINAELRRRQGGYGRGARQKMEVDQIEILGGVRQGFTTGGPVVLQITNADNRLDDSEQTPPVYRPRPGHADLAGALKWLTTDCRNTLERASARETAARTAAGALARCFLREFEIETFGFVRSLLDACTEVEITEDNLGDLLHQRDASEVYCPDHEVSQRIIDHIRRVKTEKDTVGGIVETHVFGCPPGLGSCVQFDQKLEGTIAQAVMGIQAFKAVEIGLGTGYARRQGSQAHDPITFDNARRSEASLGFHRPTNHAGGLEGGMTNGMPIVVRGTMKPISTLLQGMPSVNLNTLQADQSTYERSDVCALPAASVVMENVIAFEVTRAFLDKFAGDSMHQVQANYDTYMDLARQLPLEPVEGE